MAGGTFGGGDGSLLTPYLVEDAADLNAVRSGLLAHYKQAADIDLSAWGNWTPIGTKFLGTYDGDNYTINGLTYITATREYDKGLFLWLGPGGEVNNVNLTAVNMEGRLEETGALIGYCQGTISNCHSSGTIVATVQIGGLIGHLNNPSVLAVQNCSSSINITNFSTFASTQMGGLVGRNNGALFENSFATGNVTGKWYVGGLVGYSFFVDDFKCCYATGDVYGDFAIGGLIGCSQASWVHDCYALGNADQFDPPIDADGGIGGLIGWVDGDPSGHPAVENCYSIGTVTGTNKDGGLVGTKQMYPYDTPATISNSYYNSDTTVQTDTDRGTPKTTTELKIEATFTDWDFESTWVLSEFTNDGHPVFSYQPIFDNYDIKLIFRDKWSGKIISDATVPWIFESWGGGALYDGITALGGMSFDGTKTVHTIELSNPIIPGTYSFQGVGQNIENIVVDVVVPQTAPQVVDVNAWAVQEFTILIDDAGGFDGLTVDMQANDALGDPLLQVGFGQTNFNFQKVKAGTYEVEISQADITTRTETVIVPLMMYDGLPESILELFYASKIPITGTDSVFPLMGIRSGEIAGGIPAQSDGKRIGRSYFASANPKVYFACPAPVHPTNDPMWNLNFRVKVFYDAAATSEYLSVDTISNRELFRLAIGSVTGWETFPEGGVPPDKYGQIVECQINIPPKIEAYIRVDVGADEA